MIRKVVSALALVVLVPYVLNQVRKPTRWVGRFFLWTMNAAHSDLTDWGLEHAQIGTSFTILDVGCGGGRTIQKMAAIATEGRLFGIDYSMGSVDASRATNAKLIRTGRVEIRQAAVSQLPFPDATFDLVTAVETHYYWPDLPKDMQEVRRVVKPGGMLILIAESYKGGRHDLVQGLAMIPLRAARLSAEEHRELFAAAGFADVQVFEDRNRGWICVTGRRPEVTARIPTLATPGEGVALYTFPVATKNAAFRTSVLFAYKLNWQTVFYVGYGDDRAFEEDRDRLVPNTRQVFAKLSYAVQR